MGRKITYLRTSTVPHLLIINWLGKPVATDFCFEMSSFI